MGKENHIFSPAYREDEFEVLESCEHLVFNSFSQLGVSENVLQKPEKCGDPCKSGMFHAGEHAIYDPCAPGSVLGFGIRISGNTAILRRGLHFSHSVSRMQMLWKSR